MEGDYEASAFDVAAPSLPYDREVGSESPQKILCSSLVRPTPLQVPRAPANECSSEYEHVPGQLKDDNVIPEVSDIPSLLTSFRHPRRSRSVSIGPQSEADAYETLAYREKRRRESTRERATNTPRIDEKNAIPDYFAMTTSNSASKRPTAHLLPTPAYSNGDLAQSMLGAENALYTPLTPGSQSSANGSRRPSQERRQYEREEREMFSKLEKPRVRYDVEVITKLIVYAGRFSSSFSLLYTC